MRLSILLIGLISVYDIYLTLIYSEYIEMMERNPIAQRIICEHGLYSFILTKSILTLLVCCVCFLLSKTKYKAAVYGVLLYQIGLFLALNFWTDEKNNKAYLSDGILFFNDKTLDKHN